jgi:hypothetical protein
VAVAAISQLVCSTATEFLLLDLQDAVREGSHKRVSRSTRNRLREREREREDEFRQKRPDCAFETL